MNVLVIVNSSPRQRAPRHYHLDPSVRRHLGMDDGDIGAGWMIAMMLGMILFWGLVIVGVVWLLREAIGPSHHGPDVDPSAILDRRLAEEQISVEEHEQRKKTLTG